MQYLNLTFMNEATPTSKLYHVDKFSNPFLHDYFREGEGESAIFIVPATGTGTGTGPAHLYT